MFIFCLEKMGEQAILRKRDRLIPIGEALAGLPGPVQTLREVGPPERHFTQADQVNQLVSASEADSDRGFIARWRQDISDLRSEFSERMVHLEGLREAISGRTKAS